MKRNIPAVAALAMLLGSVACKDRSGAGGNHGAETLPEAPAGFALLASAEGDLDGDGASELAVAWMPSGDGAGARHRTLAIYRRERGRWKPWHQSKGPLLDPFGEESFHSLSISSGEILISHTGTAPRPWDFLHRYHLHEGSWALRAASISEGDICDTFTTTSFVPASGQIDLSSEHDGCDETGTEVAGQGEGRTQVLHVDPVWIPMDGFRPGGNVLMTAAGKLRF